MRINIEWVAPWMHGKPIKTWVFHTHYEKKGIIRNKSSFTIVLLGFWLSFSNDALWAGISFSINIWEVKKYEPNRSNNQD